MERFRLTRRRLLVTTGSGVLGLAIVNTVSGCSPASDDATPTPATSSATVNPGGWRRVNLSFVSAYLLVRGAEAAIVDTGIDGSADAIGAGLKAAGSGWDQVRHVILTHLHPDHAGGLAGVEPQTAAAAIYAGAADVPGIKSARPLKPVRDSDEVFGLQIIATPGHTAGHVSVFDPSTGTLVAGDALRTNSGAGLVGADPQYTADAAAATASVKKLAALDVKTILPGHGDPFTTGAADALRRLAG